MGLIPRALSATIERRVRHGGKVTILYGARQTGKTTLLDELLPRLPYRSLTVNADERRYVDVLSSRDLGAMTRLVAGYDLLFIDEAQRIPDIGINLKILIDGLPDLRIVATGSSSFELANRVSEPLTGRTWTHVLYPVSILELSRLHNPFELEQMLEFLLVYGCYPEVLSLPNDADKAEHLHEVSNAYLYKDVLELAGIRRGGKIHDLLRLLAFQIGSEVSIHELARQLSMSRDTVESYLDLLEQAFVIARLGGFSRNLRKEVTKMKKVYFLDVGIRNAVIENFAPTSRRDDVGRLWENFLVIERQKTLAYTGRRSRTFFWRTHTGAELDYIEERDGMLAGFEIKLQARRGRIPDAWSMTYPEATGTVISRDNWLDFLIPG